MDRVIRFMVSSVTVSMVRVAARVRYKLIELIKQFQLRVVLSYTYSSRRCEWQYTERMHVNPLNFPTQLANTNPESTVKPQKSGGEVWEGGSVPPQQTNQLTTHQKTTNYMLSTRTRQIDSAAN